MAAVGGRGAAGGPVGRSARAAARLVGAVACAAAFGAPVQGQYPGVARGLTSEDPPLVIARSWLPVAAVTLALPASASTHDEDVLVRVTDAALLGAIREAAAGLAVQVAYHRDAAGRYFVVSAAPEAVSSVAEAMARAARAPLPAHQVADAIRRLRSDLAFRGDLPRSQFDRILDARLRGDAGPFEGADAAPTVELDRLASQVAATRPAERWGPPVWVVVDGGRAAPPDRGTAPDTTHEPQAEPPPLAANGTAAQPNPPARTEVPSDAVTQWVGSVFLFPPGTTLLEAHFVRLLLAESLEDRRGPDLYEFDVGIDALGRLVVRFSTSADASARWESRLDDAIRDIAVDVRGSGLDRLLPRTQSRWSLELATSAGAARAAAEALLRGASEPQAAAFANSAASPPDAERLRAIAGGMSLTMRVAYGGG